MCSIPKQKLDLEQTREFILPSVRLPLAWILVSAPRIPTAHRWVIQLMSEAGILDLPVHLVQPCCLLQLTGIGRGRHSYWECTWASCLPALGHGRNSHQHAYEVSMATAYEASELSLSPEPPHAVRCVEEATSCMPALWHRSTGYWTR